MNANTSANIFKRAAGALDRYFSGPVIDLPQLMGLLLPLFVDQLFIRVINMVNTAMVASYGPEAVSAVSMVDSLNFFIVNFFIAVSTGCTVVVAQYYGRRDLRNASLTSAQSITSSVILAGIIMLVILFFTGPIVTALFGSGNAEFQGYSARYLRSSAISYPFFALIQTGLGAMRGSGDTRTSLVFSAGLNILNVICNALFLMFFRMGVEGLALSLIVSRGVIAIVVLVYMVHPRGGQAPTPLDFIKPAMHIQRSVFFVAIPNALEQAFFHGGRILTQVFIVGFGVAATTANAVVNPFSTILQIIGGTLQVALVTVAGMCIGAGRVDEAKKYIWRITIAGMAGSAALSLLFWPFLGLYLKAYNMDAETYALANTVCVLNLILTPLAWSPSFVPPSGFRAAGDGTFTTVSALLTMWVVRVISGYVLGVVLGYGLIGVWVAMFIEWVVRGICYGVRLRGDKWHRHKVIQD
jgi:putative MATE family efflux protein